MYDYTGAGGAESLAGVLAKCAVLAHLNLSYTHMGYGERQTEQAPKREDENFTFRDPK